MIDKKDRTHYFRLSICSVVVAGLLFGCGFIGGVSAEWHGPLITNLVPYYAGVPMALMSIFLFLAYKTGKRWPAAVWIPFFLVFLGCACYFITVMAYHNMKLYHRFPCYTQTNRVTGESRCMCINDQTDYLVVSGVTEITRCRRALNIAKVLSHICFAILVIGILLSFVSFVFVCNDLCCISCRRANSMPRVLVTEGGVQQTVVLQPGPSNVVYVEQGQPGPLPDKEQPPAY